LCAYLLSQSEKKKKVVTRYVDLGATLPGSSDYKLSKMRGVSVRPLTALGPGALGKAAHRHSPRRFNF
jgi:hypothetical protein